MIRHLLRTRYRIVHDTVGNKYLVEHRPWWWPIWENSTDYYYNFFQEQEALDYLTRLQRAQLPERYRVIYQC